MAFMIYLLDGFCLVKQSFQSVLFVYIICIIELNYSKNGAFFENFCKKKLRYVEKELFSVAYKVSSSIRCPHLLRLDKTG